MSEHLQPAAIEGFDALGAGARHAALEHVERCPSCRTAWLAADPSRAFALLSRVEIPMERLDKLSAGVSEAIDNLETVPVQRRVWSAVAALAASVMLAAVVGAVLWKHEVPTADLVRFDEIGILQPLEDELAGMRLVDSLGKEAQVLDMTIGETQVLMIFDESIEL